MTRKHYMLIGIAVVMDLCPSILPSLLPLAIIGALIGVGVVYWALRDVDVEDQRLKSEVKRIEGEIAKRQNGKAGTVYIISNLGSFGPDVFKVGMTRRLVPQDRVDELGDASVPFEFDVHSFMFSEDAVGLEARLHERLAAYRVNKLNARKEFFRVSLDDIERMVQETDPTASFNRTMTAGEYRASQSGIELKNVVQSEAVAEGESDE